MTAVERTQKIEKAQEKLFETIGLIEGAIGGLMIRANVQAHVINQLKILASEDHGFLSRDTNLDDVKKMIHDELNGEDRNDLETD